MAAFFSASLSRLSANRLFSSAKTSAKNSVSSGVQLRQRSFTLLILFIFVLLLRVVVGLFYKNLLALCENGYLQSRDIIQKDHIYHITQYQTFHRKIKCDLLNFRGVKNGYHLYSEYLMVSIHFFHKMATLM